MSRNTCLQPKPSNYSPFLKSQVSSLKRGAIDEVTDMEYLTKSSSDKSFSSANSILAFSSSSESFTTLNTPAKALKTAPSSTATLPNHWLLKQSEDGMEHKTSGQGNQAATVATWKEINLKAHEKRDDSFPESCFDSCEHLYSWLHQQLGGRTTCFYYQNDAFFCALCQMDFDTSVPVSKQFTVDGAVWIPLTRRVIYKKMSKHLNSVGHNLAFEQLAKRNQSQITSMLDLYCILDNMHRSSLPKEIIAVFTAASYAARENLVFTRHPAIREFLKVVEADVDSFLFGEETIEEGVIAGCGKHKQHHIQMEEDPATIAAWGEICMHVNDKRDESFPDKCFDSLEHMYGWLSQQLEGRTTCFYFKNGAFFCALCQMNFDISIPMSKHFTVDGAIISPESRRVIYKKMNKHLNSSSHQLAFEQLVQKNKQQLSEIVERFSQIEEMHFASRSVDLQSIHIPALEKP